MKTILRVALAMSLLLAATGSFAWGGNNWGPFGNNNGWGNDYNPYDEWDPRYWMEEMENAFDDDDYYGGPYGYGGPGPYGYGGPGPYGPPPGYYGPGPGGPGPYGPPPGYAPNYGPRPYGPPPGYAPRGPAPQQAPQRAPQQ